MKFLKEQKAIQDAYQAFNWLKTNIPDQQARQSFGAYFSLSSERFLAGSCR